MSDPLYDARDDGREAGLRIIEDLIRSNDLAECVMQIRTAASNDSKFNWHLIEAIASMAALGLEAGREDAGPLT